MWSRNVNMETHMQTQPQTVETSKKVHHERRRERKHEKRKRPNVSRLMSGKRLCSIPDGKLRQRFYKLRAIYLKTPK